MNTEFFAALDALEKEKGIPKEYMLEKVEAALVSAFRKEAGGAENVRILMDEQKGDVKVYKVMQVVEEVEDPLTELTLAEAKKVSRRAAVGAAAGARGVFVRHDGGDGSLGHALQSSASGGRPFGATVRPYMGRADRRLYRRVAIRR